MLMGIVRGFFFFYEKDAFYFINQECEKSDKTNDQTSRGTYSFQTRKGKECLAP